MMFSGHVGTLVIDACIFCYYPSVTRLVGKVLMVVLVGLESVSETNITVDPGPS